MIGPPQVRGFAGTVLVPAPDWQLALPGELHNCRWTNCARVARFRLNRGRWSAKERKVLDLWWHYCSEHTYGNVWLDGAMYYALDAAWYDGTHDEVSA